MPKPLFSLASTDNYVSGNVRETAPDCFTYQLYANRDHLIEELTTLDKAEAIRIVEEHVRAYEARP